jgi:hypothetical protein
MIELERKKISVHTDNEGEELCLRIDDSESYSGILNLCWLTERQTQNLIDELIKGKERLKERREKIDEAMRTTDFARLYQEFDIKYNPYPVQISRAEAFGRARSDGLIDEYTYHAAHKYYKNLWFYVGD